MAGRQAGSDLSPVGQGNTYRQGKYAHRLTAPCWDRRSSHTQKYTKKERGRVRGGDLDGQALPLDM